MTRQSEKNPEASSSHISRRDFLLGSLGVIGVSALSISHGLKMGDREYIKALDGLTAFAPSEAIERMIGIYVYFYRENIRGKYVFVDHDGYILSSGQFPSDEISRQSWIDEQRSALAKKYNLVPTEDHIRIISADALLRQRDAKESVEDVLSEYIHEIVIGDKQGRGRGEYVAGIFRSVISGRGSDGDILNPYFETRMPGLVAAEAHYSNELSSHAGAIGAFQLMPWTISNPQLNPENLSQEVVAKSFIHQAAIARNLVQQDYHTLIGYHPKRTAQLTDQFFAGSRSSALLYFYAPLLLNSYNTGSTLLSKILESFLEDYASLEDFLSENNLEYRDGMGYDFFLRFTQYARKHFSEKGYGSDAQSYTMKALAMSRVIAGGESPKLHYRDELGVSSLTENISHRIAGYIAH